RKGRQGPRTRGGGPQDTPCGSDGAGRAQRRRVPERPCPRVRHDGRPRDTRARVHRHACLGTHVQRPGPERQGRNGPYLQCCRLPGVDPTVTIRTALLTATILALSAGNSTAQTARTGAMMREKLAHAQKILEALTTSNRELLTAESG